MLGFGLGHCDLRCRVTSERLKPLHLCAGNEGGNGFIRPGSKKGKFLFVLLCQPTVCYCELTSYSSALLHLSARKGG